MTTDFRNHPDRHCRGRSDIQWFPPPGSTGARAKAVCAGCPVIEPCLDFAVRHELYGVLGATTGRERRLIRRRLGIQVESPYTMAFGLDHGGGA